MFPGDISLQVQIPNSPKKCLSLDDCEELAKLCDDFTNQYTEYKDGNGSIPLSSFYTEKEIPNNGCYEASNNQWLLTPPSTPPEKQHESNNFTNDDQQQTGSNININIDDLIQPISADQFYQDLLKAEVAEMDLKNGMEHVTRKLGKRQEKIKTIDLYKVDRWNRNTHLHNILERQRRQSLRNSFSQLRVHIPSLHDNEKAPKIMILTEALRFIQNLHYMDQKLQTDLELQRCRNQLLRERIKLMCNF